VSAGPIREPKRHGATAAQESDGLVDLPLGHHCLVVAGPGTGKTWTLAKRVERIVARGDCEADEIAVLTLTQSIARHLQCAVPHGRVGTFHSFSLYQLNSIGEAVRRRIADPWEQKKLVVPDLQLLLGQNPPRAEVVDQFLRKLGAGFRENQTAEPELGPVERQLREAWLFLRDFMQFRLFDELAYDLLRHLESGGTLPRAPKLILVDEYQDLTPCELALLRAIAERHRTAVFVCGDDRQSIFGFREADPLALNNFCSVYGVQAPVYLSVTWRCPEAVCRLAEEVAAQIPVVPTLSGRPPLQPHPDLPPGEVAIRTFPSTVAEARWVHSQIGGLLDQGNRSGEIMVIVPYGLDVYLNFLNEAASLDGSGITYYDTRTEDPTRELDEFRSLYAFCRLAEHQNDQLAWRTLLHMARGWGRRFMEGIFHVEASSFVAALRGVAGLDARAARLLRSIEDTIQKVQCASCIDEACEAVGGWLNDLAGVGSPDWSPVLNLPEVRELFPAEVAGCERMRPAEPEFDCRALGRALLAASSAQRADRPAGEKEIGVHTVHQAKGLEADHVFLMGAFTQAFVDRSPADGIRRLYVAVTRAKISLAVTLGRFVKGRRNALSQRLGLNSVELTPHVVEAAKRAGVLIKSMQRQPRACSRN